ncbi:hypothetical protein BB2000_3337 [Proteus mirabilis BB2000]|nr:hypothetical protein BB2000_3337 [Proteus mirabilis BB2000]
MSDSQIVVYMFAIVIPTLGEVLHDFTIGDESHCLN